MDPFEANGAESKYTGHRASVKCLAATEVDGRTIVASGDQGNSLHFWDLSTRQRSRLNPTSPRQSGIVPQDPGA